MNGQRIIETRLCHGDTIHFGQLELQYLSSAKGGPQPLPTPNKKTVDLSQNRNVATGHLTTQKPVSYGSASPFRKQKKGTSQLVLQAIFFVLGLIALVLLAIFITHMHGALK